jgi:Fur family peroxide stress response transcriptional regulator
MASNIRPATGSSLRMQGQMKYSRQRESIQEFLISRTDHPSADVIYENMKLIYPNISLGTVYRNLSLLADIGEIRKLSNFAGADRYDGRTDNHCHFVCTQCGRVMDVENLDLTPLMESAGKDFPGEITDCNARFFGLCNECIKKNKIHKHY